MSVEPLLTAKNYSVKVGKMIRNDFILIAVLIIISLTPLAMNFDSEKKFAVVKINGAIVQEIDLTADEIFKLATDDGENVIEIKNGTARVISADCPDKICMRRGAIKNFGEVIACVPHKLLIEIASD